MHRMYKHGTKARLCFSGGPHAPVNMADSMEVMLVGTKCRKWHICCTVLHYISYMPSFCNSLKFLETSIALLDPETVQLPAFSILSAMFTGTMWPTGEAKPRFGATLKRSDRETRLNKHQGTSSGMTLGTAWLESLDLVHLTLVKSMHYIR